MQGRTATEPSTAFMIVFDNSELNPAPGAALTILCKGCGHLFESDFEERFCGLCVKRRELLFNIHPER